EKERRQALVAEQRRDDVGDVVGEPAPVRAELERHGDPRNDSHAERDGEDFGAEDRDAEVDVTPGEKAQALHHGDERGEADGEGRHEEVPRHDPGELEPRQQQRIEMHAKAPSGGRTTTRPPYRRFMTSPASAAAFRRRRARFAKTRGAKHRSQEALTSVAPPRGGATDSTARKTLQIGCAHRPAERRDLSTPAHRHRVGGASERACASTAPLSSADTAIAATGRPNRK